jgi:hypothetical protein
LLLSYFSFEKSTTYLVEKKYPHLWLKTLILWICMQPAIMSPFGPRFVNSRQTSRRESTGQLLFKGINGRTDLEILLHDFFDFLDGVNYCGVILAAEFFAYLGK